MEGTISRIGILEVVVKRQEINVVHCHVVALVSGQQKPYIQQHCSIEPADGIMVGDNLGPQTQITSNWSTWTNFFKEIWSRVENYGPGSASWCFSDWLVVLLQ